MTSWNLRFIFITTVLLVLGLSASAQQRPIGKISGHIKLDNSWTPIIYLSYIKAFDDLYSISSETIISETGIDSLGYFEFEISFLPESDNLFRLHIAKKGDVPASLIIGGKDENHLFLIANRYSIIEIDAQLYSPPFRKVFFNKSDQNIAFQKITGLCNMADSIGSISGASKRSFIENKLYEQLLYVADTSKNSLVSLYAVYRGNFESHLSSNSDFYNSYLEKWRDENSTYFAAFKKRAGFKTQSSTLPIIIIIACATFIVGLLIGSCTLRRTNKIEKLSAQERKIFELLKQGASNQEISDQYHIEISTVKSHVSNILSKLNMKSRKEIMNV